MKIINYKDVNENFFEKIELELINSVDEIINKVKVEQDCALIELSKKFGDGDFQSSDDFIVSEEEIKEAYKKIKPELLNAMKIAINNVKEFALKQLSSIKELEFKKNGSTLGHKIIPLESVLCYCPGGNYPLLSSCYMTIIPAVVAGVKEIYLTSPKISAEVIVAAHLSGATKIYKLGGAQAICAFAYGTQTIKPVDKIVGPGNKFVAAAKKAIYGQCDIDFIAGPSEVLVVADDIRDFRIIAADLLAQCEHDKDARGYLITTNPELAIKVQNEAREMLKHLKTADIAQVSFEQSTCVIVDDINQAIELSNLRAPEHLELLAKEAIKRKDEFKNYGSLFLGQGCAEVFGDYCSGTNHVLPTNKCAKYTGGLSVFDYIKIQTYQKLSDSYSKELSKTASILAEAEGLYAHKLASDLRNKDYNLRYYLNRFRDKRREIEREIFSFLTIALFHVIRFFYNCKCINYPKEKCIFALWHAHQCGVFSCNQNRKTAIMVSSSRDGEIISRAANAMGVETVRGSKTRGGAKASLELIKKIKEEDMNGALTIDGPKGPNRIVKKGIIEIARMAGVPVVPAVWWSKDKTFLKFKSWDEFRFPLIGTRLVMLFGDPIEVPKDPTDEEVEIIRKKIEDSLNELYVDIKKNYKEYVKRKD